MGLLISNPGVTVGVALDPPQIAWMRGRADLVAQRPTGAATTNPYMPWSLEGRPSFVLHAPYADGVSGTSAMGEGGRGQPATRITRGGAGGRGKISL